MITVALAFDDKYMPHGSTTIASLLSNCDGGDEFRIIVLDTGLSSESRSRLKTLVESKAKLDIVEVSENLIGHLPSHKHAVSTYARLFLADLVPELRRVIYLDSDVLVLGSLRPMWETCLGDSVCGVVQDAMCQMSPLRNDADNLPNVDTRRYFNAGVMLIDLDKWQSFSVKGRTLEVIDEMRERLRHSDQDALNVVLAGKVKFLHPKWNFQIPLFWPIKNGFSYESDWHEAQLSPVIVHFTTSRKPWLFGNCVPFKRVYWKYRAIAKEPIQENERMGLASLLSKVCDASEIMRHRMSYYLRTASLKK